MEESTVLAQMYQKEIDNNLYDVLLKGFPLWRLVRYRTRNEYLISQTGYQARTSNPKCIGRRKPKLFSGLWNCLFSKNLTLCFPFNRLVFSNGLYLDKFIDPAIEESELKDNAYLVIDPPNYEGEYSRMHKDHTLDNENRVVSVQILYRIFKKLAPLFYKRQVELLYEKVQKCYKLPDLKKGLYYETIAHFSAYYYFYLFWFKIIKPKRVLFVYREGYFPLIAACKKLHIPVAEFQHGITMDKTVSFTGDYDLHIDPDYFLVFGEYWKGPQFGVDVERIHCIGWAYKDLVAKQINSKEKMDDNVVLVISSPEISDAILDALAVLSKKCPNIKFHIRLHPCESYNDCQKEKLSLISNALITDNKRDSAIVLPLYKYVIGENSSVVYEALSVGCHVGLLNFCGLQAPIDKPGIADSFSIIRSPDDFKAFLDNNIEKNASGSCAFYSDFNSCKFMEFLNNYM